ncbi:LuxR C-terminal-related transcriptional regulator [Corynebacterium freneyi]|uniref:helix-turn-helix transcriptional regulator n=1 Tax=Corynebacterium freneyi TaxID=134034 RepID=UPI0025507B29|nr:LuxR family transcriptional regulator [Corynebacterium freneyi]MDK8768208.1 LuxR C-terminal-related transcriptional regulator [Corynebacterium freneyi]
MSSPRAPMQNPISRAPARALIDRVQAVGPGEGVLAVLTGPTGSGKSSLVREVLANLPGFQGIHVSALPWEADRPGTVLEHVAARAGAAPADALSEASLLESGPGGVPSPSAIAGLATRLARHVDVPSAATAIVVDDAHHADSASLRQLAGMTRRFLHSRIAVILACDDAGGAADDEIRSLSDIADVVASVPPLQVSEVRELVYAAVGVPVDAAAAVALRRITGGWPARIREVLQAAPADHWHDPDPSIPLPTTWATSLRGRLSPLSDGVRRIVEAVAIFDHDAPVPLVRDLADDSDGSALDDAVAAGLLRVTSRPGDSTVDFTVPMDRAVLLAELPPARRADLHGRAADRLAQAGDPVGALHQRADAADGPDAALSEELAAYGRATGARGHWRDAARNLRLASELADDDETREILRLDAIEAMISSSDIPEARLHARSLGAGATGPHQDSLLGYLALHEGRRGEARYRIDRAVDAIAAAEPGTDELPADLRARVAARKALLGLVEWLPHEVVDWNKTAAEWSGHGDGASAESSAIALIGQSAIDGTRPGIDRRQADSPLHAQRRDMALGWLSLVHDDPVVARQLLQNRTQAEGSERISLWMDGWLARSHYVLGEWGDAMTVVERGLARAERYEIRLLEPLLLWTGAQIAAFRGDTGLARSYVNRLSISPDAFLIQSIPSAMCRMQVATLATDSVTAARAGDLLADINSRRDILQPGFWPWEDIYAQALLRVDRIDEAEAVTDAALDRHDRASILSLQAKMSVPAGGLAIARGDVDEGLRLLDDGVEAIEALPMPAYQSRITYEYGQMLRRLGRRRRADEMFARAGEIFAAMGATEFVERCNRERRAGGLGARTTDAAGLTPQEAEIAALIADGASNREAAAELFLSPKTVEYHLTRVYRKLGIRTRSELPTALRRR